MNSSKSSRKPVSKISYKPISPFEMFYQLTYMSAMASAGITRSKTFELAAECPSPASQYFVGINTLVQEFRFDYPEACRRVGLKAKSANIKSFLLRLSDALRSGEPLAEYLAREAAVQGEDYQNGYERDLESMKQWSNAFSSIVISVALIVIIQVISSMIYSMDVSVMTGLVSTGLIMAGFGAWIIYRSSPQEKMTVPAAQGSAEQKRALNLSRLLLPVSMLVIFLMNSAGVDRGYILMTVAGLILPIGIVSFISDVKTTKKDKEFSTFLRSTGGMATSSGTTLKEALTKIDLSSFPALEKDIVRLSTRLQARVDPGLCWHKFGFETGSKLISQVADIFYGAIQIGGDPERVGYLCSLFTSKTSQLRAKRRLASGTFSGLTTVMQGVVAGLMIFVLSIVENFAILVKDILPQNNAAADGQASMNLGMADFTAAELNFLTMITVTMILLLAIVSAAAITLGDGGYRLKFALYFALTLFISGASFILVPPLVSGILTL